MKRPQDVDWDQLTEIVDIDGRLVVDAPWLTQDLGVAMQVTVARRATTFIPR
jgi:hypothetical protein